MKWPIVLVKIAKLISTHAITVGTGDSKCGRGRRCAMSAVAQQSETYFNMAAKGQSNDLSTDAVREAVLADRDESQESEEIDEEESVNGESEEDVISEKIELCLQAFDSFDLPDVNMEMFKKCVRRQIEASYRVFQSPTDPLKILLNAPVNCGTILYDETKLWLDKIKFRLGGKVSIRRPYQCEILRNLPKEIIVAFRSGVVRSRLQDVVDNISLAENNKCYAISFTRMEAVVVLFSVLSGMPEGTVRSYFTRRVQNGRAKVIVNLEKDFVFLYKIKAGQLLITFHYGLWNKSGFPLHS